MSDWQFTNPNAVPRIVVTGGVTYKEIPQISRLHPDGTKEVHPMFINGSGVEIEKVYLEEVDKKRAVIMPEQINLLEVPGSQWQWLCDVQLKPFQKKIIESAKRAERINRKVKGGSYGK